jgi:hypothetical protein
VISDPRQLYAALCAAVSCVLLAWVILLFSRYAARARDGLRLWAPLAAAAAMRLAAAAVVSSSPSLSTIRGPDEAGFVEAARRLAWDTSLFESFPDNISGGLHLWYLAAQIQLTDAPGDYYLRVAHITLAVAAIALIGIAVYDVAGARAATIAAWILACEPSNIFFSGLLHKESPMLLADGLVILGCVRIYTKRDWQAGALMATGLVIAGLTRPYAGAALAVACAAATLHASLRRIGRGRVRAPRLAFAVVVAVTAVSIVVPASASVLDRLQTAQNANVSSEANLKLEPVDFSTPEGVAVDGPRRVFDLLFRPYPWQVENMSQRLGVVGSITAWALLASTAALAVSRGRLALRRLPPFLYVLVPVTLMYALATGNAGTGFRYRTHILVVLTAAFAALTTDRDGKSQSGSARRQ